MRAILIVFLATCSAAVVLGQRSATGTLRVSAQIDGSLSVVFTASSGPTVYATGRNSTTFTVPTVGGSFSMNSAPIAAGDTTFLISSPFEIEVTRANLLSGSYTLRSWLNSPDPVHSWLIDSAEISKGGNQVISSHEFYGVPNQHTLTVSGAASALQNLTNAITFQVVAN
ncbi:MAG TPA: hypothetical protein VK419_08625 [Bryobacteraceae bacterium]|nr:hypothetical protein [Bryobacteraceae bacterium]